MADSKNDSKSKVRRMAIRAAKAVVKGALFYVFYYVVWMFLTPLAEMVPGLQQSVEGFAAVYIVLLIVGELTGGTIYQYLFGAAKALFVIFYLILSLNGGMIGITFENVNILVDLRLFLMVAMLLSLLGLAKSVLQAINFMSEKAEYVPLV